MDWRSYGGLRCAPTTSYYLPAFQAEIGWCLSTDCYKRVWILKEETIKPKKDTHKVDIRSKPRGQQMGTAGAVDQNRKEMKETPAVLGRRRVANKLAADESAQHIGGDAVTPRTTSPSTPAMTGGVRAGESGGEKVFTARLKKQRPRKRQ
jgi:hypothetical protein